MLRTRRTEHNITRGYLSRAAVRLSNSNWLRTRKRGRIAARSRQLTTYDLCHICATLRVHVADFNRADNPRP